MAYNNLANDGSLQQFSELRESSRDSQRMSADPDNLRLIMLEKSKSDHQQPDVSLREISMQQPNRNVRRDLDEHGRQGIRQVDMWAVDSMDIAEDDDGVLVGKGSKDLREYAEDKHESHPKLETRLWLGNNLMRQQSQGSRSGASSNWCPPCEASGTHCICATNIQTGSHAPSLAFYPRTDSLPAVPMGSTLRHPGDAVAELSVGQPTTGPASSRYMNIGNANQVFENSESRGRNHEQVGFTLHMESATDGNVHERARSSFNARGDNARQRNENMPLDRATKNWHEARLKAKVLTHPMFSEMLAAHIGCLRILTPVDRLPEIDEQLEHSQDVIDKYSIFAPVDGEDIDDKEELDDFMRKYTMVLLNMQQQLQNHVRLHAAEAMLDCLELQMELYTLTGIAPGPGTGATMSDDELEDEQATESDGAEHKTDRELDVEDSSGSYGPLAPTESERCHMERVRQELKLALNAQLEDDKERLINKAKLELKQVNDWFVKQHSTLVAAMQEDDKERLINEARLELKQVNNWFVKQRKRNWHSK